MYETLKLVWLFLICIFLDLKEKTDDDALPI
jgi:hypothetical protein